MTFETSLGIMFSALKGLFIYMLIVVIATMAATVLLTILCRNLGINDRRFRFLGLFFNMDTISAVGLACAWAQFVIALIMIFDTTQADIVRYILYLMPVLLSIILIRPIKELPVRLLINVLEVAGVISVNIIKGYINDNYSTAVLLGILICMTVMMVLYSLYVFLLELDKISTSRRGNLYLDTDIFE